MASDETPTLLIVYHSQSGSTERMAGAVIRGATAPDIGDLRVVVRRAFDAQVDDVLGADGYVFGTPENFGYMSGALKDFFDRVYYPCLDRLQGRPYAVFVRAGNDGSGALTSIRRIVSGLALREVCDPVIVAGDFDESRLAECETLGMTLAAGLEAGVF